MLNLPFFQKLKSIYLFFKKGHLIVTASAIFLLCLSAYFGAALTLKAVQIKAALVQLSGDNQGKIVVTGEGKVVKRPDIAIVTLGINQENIQLSVAQNRVNRVVSQFIDSIKQLRILPKDIKTIGYSVYPRYQYDSQTGKRSLAAYVINEKLQIKIRDFNSLNILFQKATDLGLNEANGLRFGFENDMALKNEARARAIDNAQKKARLLAKQLNLKLNRLIDFHESDVSPPLPLPRLKASAPIGAENKVAPRIEPGASETRVKVTLTYSIK